MIWSHLQCLSHSKPSEIEEEFDRHEYWIVDVQLLLFLYDGLLSDERDKEVDVDRQGDHLGVDQGDLVTKNATDCESSFS